MEPSKTNRPSLFISYSSRDKSLIKQLVSGLQSSIDVMYDENLIKDGSNWRKALEDGLANADGVVVVLTPNSISSGFVTSELGAARVYARDPNHPKIILPVLYGLTDIPEFVSDLYTIRWDEKNTSDVIDRIINAVKDFTEQDQPEKSNQSQAPNKRPTSKKTSSKIASEPAPDEMNYWLVKMNPGTWQIESLKVGDTTFLSTYYFQTKRPQYELFQKVKQGDKVIGYASGQYNSVVCLMEVTDPVGPDKAQGEIFKMKVTEIVMPRILLDNFKNIIPDIVSRLHYETSPPELFFELSKETYQQILDANKETVSNFENTYEPFYLTEGNHRDTVDQLDFESDIESFASVISLRKVNPPLAIGLFGNWGSGKSFFMEKLSEEIEKKATSGDPDYVEHVVPVKFNSWHYSDSNLWASLITQIFESLNDYAIKKKYGADAIKEIYEKLEITGTQITEAKSRIEVHATQIKDLQQQQDDIQHIIGEKRETLSMFNNKDIVGIIIKDPLIQKDLAEIMLRLNTDEVSKELKNLGEVKNNLTRDFTAVKNLTDIVGENLKGKRVWIIVSAVLFFIIMMVMYSPLFTNLSEKLRPIIKNIAAAVSFITAALVFLRNKLSPHIQQLEKLYDRVKSVRDTVKQKAGMAELNEDVLKSKLEVEIKSLEEKKKAIQEELEKTKAEHEKLKGELTEIGSGKMLANFLASKSTDDTYSKQLGIISWIRKDFSKLNDLFVKQEVINENNQNVTLEAAAVQLKIDRIVLYIDDLDRCNEDIVVKVLEAIHLLLAFKLFVVVVGVDPRWLNNALSEKYKTLFSSKKENGLQVNDTDNEKMNKPDEVELFLSGVATSYDYLEKIFQIPFTLKPINKTGREKLIQYLIKDELAEEKPKEGKAKGSQEQNKVDPEDPANPAAKEISDEERKKMEQEMQKQKELKELEEKKAKEKKVKQRLVFTQAELDYMKKLSELFGQSPRAINRYVNIYRIVKAHKGMKVVGDFSSDEFIPIMFTLGVVIGYSVFAQEFIDKIKNADGKQALKDFIKDADLNENLVTAVSKYTDDEIGGMPMEIFKRNLELISRFSFRTLLKPVGNYASGL